MRLQHSYYFVWNTGCYYCTLHIKQPDVTSGIWPQTKPLNLTSPWFLLVIVSKEGDEVWQLSTLYIWSEFHKTLCMCMCGKGEVEWIFQFLRFLFTLKIRWGDSEHEMLLLHHLVSWNMHLVCMLLVQDWQHFPLPCWSAPNKVLGFYLKEITQSRCQSKYERIN